MFVSVFVCLVCRINGNTSSLAISWCCLRVATIIITWVGKPSRTIDLLGSSFLIHSKPTNGVNSTQGKL